MEKLKSALSNLKTQTVGISIPVYLLVIIFGSSSWINVNSVFLELPLMVFILPEQWGLPSYLAIICQIAIIFPIAYSLFKKFGPRLFNPAPWIAILIGIEALCMLLIAFFWDQTAIVFNTRHSVALLSLFFILSAIDSTSNVMFLPYMANFKPPYTTAYFIGTGVSALVPTVIGLIQGCGQIKCIPVEGNNSESASGEIEYLPKSIPPLFDVKVYNILIFLWMCLTLGAFCLIHWSKMGKRERWNAGIKRPATELSYPPAKKPLGETPSTAEIMAEEREEIEHGSVMSKREYYGYLGLTGFGACIMNGVLISIPSYSALPYGQEAFHLSIALSRLSNTLGSFLPVLVPCTNFCLVVLWTAVGTAFSGYLLFLSALSPDPILDDSLAGAALCVISWILSIGILAYVRTVIGGNLRKARGDSERKLFFCGVFTQAGSFIGALVMFILIGVVEVFKQATPCPHED